MTASRGYQTLFHRHVKNPILTAADWPYPAHSVFNPGATLLKDGTTLLLCRVEDRRGLSHLCAARSVNGVDGWVIDPKPTLCADPENHPEELWGIEDPRITFVDELGKFVIAYTAFGKAGPGVALALTQDFRTFERCGLVMQPDDKDAALLPRRIDGSFALIHRPMTDSGAHVWMSLSPDLRNWGSHKLVLSARKGGWWDANKVGLSPPLIETPEGWLMLYHGVRQNAAGCLYRLGAPRPRTNKMATSTTSRSRADIPSPPTATRCVSTTARPTRAWRSPPAAFARSSPGCASIPLRPPDPGRPALVRTLVHRADANNRPGATMPSPDHGRAMASSPQVLWAMGRSKPSALGRAARRASHVVHGGGADR